MDPGPTRSPHCNKEKRNSDFTFHFCKKNFVTLPNRWVLRGFFGELDKILGEYPVMDKHSTHVGSHAESTIHVCIGRYTCHSHVNKIKFCCQLWPVLINVISENHSQQKPLWNQNNFLPLYSCSLLRHQGFVSQPHDQ